MNELEPLNDRVTAVDDCWNRIGIYGDRSCERLPAHVHCHNCERYGAAAVELLDRYALVREQTHQQTPIPAASGIGHIVFRLGEQWLALPSALLNEVSLVRPIHSVPHQRHRALLGVSNVRGTLVACLSLAHILAINDQTASVNKGRVVPRMLVLNAADGPLVVPVDEVAGIEPLPVNQALAAQGLDDAGLGRFADKVLAWSGRSVTLLDAERLLNALVRVLQ